jgi:hypothetical protein
MDDISYERSSGNVFADLGFSPAEAEELTIKITRIATIVRLANCLTALGRTVEIRVRPYDSTAITDHMAIAS